MSLPNSASPTAINKAKQLFQYLTTGWRYKALNGLLFIATFALIGRILYDERETLTTFDWNIRPGWLILATVCLLLDMLMGGHMWHLLIKRFTTFNRPLKNIKYWWYANLAKRIPGPIWYIASRSLLYEQHQISKRQTSALAGLELALILVTGVLTTAITTPFWFIPSQTLSSLATIWYLPLLFLPCILAVHPRFLRWVWRKLNPQAAVLDITWRDTAVWITYYIAIWLLGGFVLFCLINAVIPLTPMNLIPVIGMWAFANTISMTGSLTFFGFGLREVSLIFLLAQIVPAPVALILTIGVRIFWLLGELITILLSLLL